MSLPLAAATRGLVRGYDRLARWWLDIADYVDDERCILRLSRRRLRHPLVLANGTRLEPGQRVGQLHLWNEHLPQAGEQGADVRWGAAFYRRFVHSMRRLTEHLAQDAADADLAAFEVRAMFEGWDERQRLPRIGRRLGFEPAAEQPGAHSAIAWWRSLAESVLVQGLILAFNPGSSRKSPLHRRPQQLWISRTSLMERYGRAGRECSGDAVGERRDGVAHDGSGVA